MYCKNCGKKNPDGAIFCRKCGLPLDGVEPINTVTTAEPAPATPTQMKSANIESVSASPTVRTNPPEEPVRKEVPFKVTPVKQVKKKESVMTEEKTVKQEDHLRQILLTVIAIAAIAAVVILGLALIKNGGLSKADAREKSAEQEESVLQKETTNTEEPVTQETATPEEPVLPTKGISSTGSTLLNITYNADGTISSLDEVDGMSDIHWEYVYNSAGQFIYRTRYSEDVPMLKSSAGLLIPNTDITYKILAEPIDNCAGFVFDYRICEFKHGSMNGDRWIYVAENHMDSSSWKNVGRFEYEVFEVDMAWHEISVNFDIPKTLDAFGTPRVFSDDSIFDNDHALKAVWLADYEYIEPV